jgi:hypothetical protein
MTFIAFIIALLLNGGGITPVTAEDSVAVPVMGQVAMAALNEAHPECESSRWDYNVDASDGITVTAFGDCEFAAQFYLSPETGLWSFAIEGA